MDIVNLSTNDKISNNCFYNAASNNCGLEQNFTNGGVVNVTYHFTALIRFGIAVFCIKAVFFLVHLFKP